MGCWFKMRYIGNNDLSNFGFSKEMLIRDIFMHQLQSDSKRIVSPDCEMEVEYGWRVGEGALKKMMTKYFIKLFTLKGSDQSGCLENISPSISEVDNEYLMAPFTEEN